MNSTRVRRVLLLIIALLWLLCFWFWRKTGHVQGPSEPELAYKVRAYVTSKQEAEKIKDIGKSLGYNGSIEKGNRTIKKFMGYVVEQDFSVTDDPEKVDFINEFLKEKGYESRLIKSEDGKKLTIRAGDIYSDEKEAREISDSVNKLTKVTFDVRKFIKDTSYKAFIIVFPDIKHKEKASELREKITKVTSDVEIISY